MTLELTDYEAEWLRDHLGEYLGITKWSADVVQSIFNKLGGDDSEPEEEQTPEEKEMIHLIAMASIDPIAKEKLDAICARGFNEPTTSRTT